MKKAWIENGTIRDVCHGDPAECYHPDVAKLYTEEVPDEAENGDSWNGATLTKPVIPAPPPPAPVPKLPITRAAFLLRFTGPERVAIKAARATDPMIDDLWEILDALSEVHLDHPEMVRGLSYLTQQGLLAQGRAAEILN